MQDIHQYMLKPLSERQGHLELTQPCVHRGGDPSTVSFYMKGLLAYILNTTLPSGHKIHVCHACHDSVCSNPYHVYWGTPRENRLDAISCGKAKSVWAYTVAKYGEQKAREMQSPRARRAAQARWNNNV